MPAPEPPRRPFAADLTVDGKTYPLYERVYLLLAATFAVLLVLTNIIGMKLFQAPAYEVTSAILRERGLVKKKGPVKVLGGGEISKPLTVEVDAVSDAAREKLTAAGGTVL